VGSIRRADAQETGGRGRQARENEPSAGPRAP
jgi:hypothetical protein